MLNITREECIEAMTLAIWKDLRGHGWLADKAPTGYSADITRAEMAVALDALLILLLLRKHQDDEEE